MGLLVALRQVMLLPEYRKLPFTQTFGCSPFPVVPPRTIPSAGLQQPTSPAGKIYAWTVLGLAIVFTWAISACTVPTAIAPRSARLAAPQTGHRSSVKPAP